jgi:hypothetical protein
MIAFARPWQQRQAEHRQACQEHGHRLLADAAARLPLTPAQRAEATRLIALPYGAEGFALRRFVMAHTPTKGQPCAS